MTIIAHKPAQQDATARYFDQNNTSFDSPEYEPPYLGGMLFLVTMEYRIKIEDKIDTGIWTEYVMCLSWQDAVDTLPRIAEYVAENWTRDDVGVKIVGLKVATETVNMSKGYRDFILREVRDNEP